MKFPLAPQERLNELFAFLMSQLRIDTIAFGAGQVDGTCTTTSNDVPNMSCAVCVATLAERCDTLPINIVLIN